jgi:hypothetical protein
MCFNILTDWSARNNSIAILLFFFRGLDWHKRNTFFKHRCLFIWRSAVSPITNDADEITPDSKIEK